MMHEQDESNNTRGSVKNTLRYRVRNSCGTDGKTLRIVCFTGMALLIVLMSVLIHNDNHNDNNSLRGPSASTQIYSDYDWMELAPHVQQAAVKLGWDQRSWNMDLDTASSIHQWEQLSTEQKAAATLLGYNKETWCTDTDNNVAGYYNAEQNTAVPSNVYSSSDTESDTSSDTESDTSSDTSSETDSATMDESLYYRDYDWNELPAMAQEAAAKFGYTTAEQWTNQIEFGTDWDELTEELRAAAVVLGYTKDTWCLDDSLSESDSSSSDQQLTDDVSLSGSEDTQEPQLTDDVSLSGSEDTTEPTDSVTSSPTEEDTEADFSNEDWIDLPNDMKNAAISLGYNQEKWDETMDDGDIMPFDKKWKELTETQQDAVSMLFGYNPETWDEEYLQSIMNQIDEQDWDELTPEIQQAATILGFTQNSWDNADNDDDASYVEPPSITLMEWTELTEEQQMAATTLGWNEQKWSFDRSI
eukprot:CAMPEP_0170778398 /NCGR_PEP_ID=MMETSP0733-20121128/12369_1 /TAXON_ID=186038 /ORGANISM="Fragilariopsis kerguelensis, Strain L26-C5" /LENGTH=471 /DNA_ID=CAMNT_0011121817 /DNA_START=407 /DNA_END=1822 /DNA_ORIENTATION=-